MGSFGRILTKLIETLGIFVVAFILWEILASRGIISPLAMPAPSDVLISWVGLIESGRFIKDVIATGYHWIIALFFGILIGSSLGFIAGLMPLGSRIVVLPAAFLRALPPITLFPIALIAWGPGGTPVVFVASVGAAAYVFPSTVVATQNASSQYRELAQIVGCKNLSYIWHFIAPATSIHVIAAARVAATYAFVICIAAEMVIGGVRGVGAAVLEYSELYRLEEAYSYVIFSGLVGVSLDGIFAWVAKKSKRV